ncbi:MAG TPA: hypothetical protein VJV78_34230 [Polyangiales bacterium]|nr:hypothetical protein [Polyangiales bacterium]
MLCRSQLLVACFLSLLTVVSCAGQSDKQQAEQVLARHFDMRAHSAYDAALADYDDRFFEQVTRSEWRSALASVASKLGPFQGYDVMVDERQQRQLAGPGTYLKYKCKVTYSKHSSMETLYLFRREGATKFKILGHQIDSLGLAQR